MAKAKVQRKVAMSLMAHPDDCEILAGGTMVLLQQRGWEVHVVTMTPGDAGSATLGPVEIAAIRRKEAAKAAAVIGAEYHCLEARDFYVNYDSEQSRRALEIMRDIAPSLVFTHSLDDYMMDHEMAARLARCGTFGYAVPNASPRPVVKGSMVPYLYYADPLEGIDVYGYEIQPSTYVDISKAMATKTKMLRCHASQRDWLLKHHGVDEYTRAMKAWCAKRGKENGTRYAEAFRQHKGHPYPNDCLLARELGDLVIHPDEIPF